MLKNTKMRCKNKEDIYNGLATWKHKYEAEKDNNDKSKVKIALLENEIESINYDKSRLKQALEIVSEWNSLGGGFCDAHDVQCQIDFYRQSAQDALDIVKTLEK